MKLANQAVAEEVTVVAAAEAVAADVLLTKTAKAKEVMAVIETEVTEADAVHHLTASIKVAEAAAVRDHQEVGAKVVRQNHGQIRARATANVHRQENAKSGKKRVLTDFCSNKVSTKSVI